MQRLLRHLVPRSVRRGVSVQLAERDGRRVRRQLESMARSDRPIVAGPWFGEVGFELLYWVPFLAWFAESFGVRPDRLVIVSRGGTAAWYRPFAAEYREIFDRMSPDDFRRQHDVRVSANGEQKQTRVLASEQALLRAAAADIHDPLILHPSTMYRLFNPFWWGHVGEQWVHRFTRYRRMTAPSAVRAAVPPAPYVAVKFYFNECFPATDRNRDFVRAQVRRLVERGPVVSLTTGLNLDDHGGCDLDALGVRPLPAEIDAGENLTVQTALVAGASAFVGTYGGFSYLAPLHGVRSVAYYSDAGGFSPRHLAMARSAFSAIGSGDLFSTRAVSEAGR